MLPLYRLLASFSQAPLIFVAPPSMDSPLGAHEVDDQGDQSSIAGVVRWGSNLIGPIQLAEQSRKVSASQDVSIMSNEKSIHGMVAMLVGACVRVCDRNFVTIASMTGKHLVTDWATLLDSGEREREKWIEVCSAFSTFTIVSLSHNHDEWFDGSDKIENLVFNHIFYQLNISMQKRAACW